MQNKGQILIKLYTVKEAMEALICGSFSSDDFKEVTGNDSNLEDKFFKLWDWITTNYRTSNALLETSSIILTDIIEELETEADDDIARLKAEQDLKEELDLSDAPFSRRPGE